MKFNVKYLWALLPLLLVGSILYYFSEIVTYVLLAWVISMIGAPVVVFLRKYIGKNLSALITLSLFVLGFILLVWVFIPPLVNQIENLSKINYTQVVSGLEEPIKDWEKWLVKKKLMIATDTGIEAAQLAGQEGGVGGQRADQPQAFAAQALQGRFDDLDFLPAQVAILARMRVQAEHGDDRFGDPEVAAQGGIDDAQRAVECIGRDRIGDCAQRHMHGQQGDPHDPVGQHHHHLAPRMRGEQAGGAGEGDAALVDRGLVHGAGHHAVAIAVEAGLRGAGQRCDHRGRIRGFGNPEGGLVGMRDLDQFEGIVPAMAERLADGPLPITDLANELADEYGVQCSFEPISVHTARWLQCDERQPGYQRLPGWSGW